MGLKRFAAMLLAASIMLLAGCSSGGAYPGKPITMVIPYSAGGTTDLTGRKLAALMEKQLGQPIHVVNQAGASGTVGCKTVLDAAPDGYTVLFTADSLGTQRVMGLSEMSYNDFSPVAVTVNDPKVIVVGKDSTYTSLQELVDDMRARPGKVKMSYTGPGGSGHVQSLIYNKFGLDMALTAYPGGSECILAVLGGQVDFTNSNYSTVRGYLASGDLVMLGVSSSQGLEAWPQVPTLEEVLPEASEYLRIPFTPLSLLVAKDVPADITQTLRTAAHKAMQQDEWKDYVAENCLEKLYELYPDEEAERLFYAEWEAVVSWLLYDAGAAQNSPEVYGIPRV